MSRDLVRSVFSNVPTLRDDFFFPIEQYFNDFFDHFWGGNTLDAIKAKSGYPKVEIASEEGKLVVRAAVPGVAFQDLSVEVVDVSNNVDELYMLKISGRMSEEHENKGAQYHRRELRKSAFSREIMLPKDLENAQQPEATLKDGILTLKWNMIQKGQSNPKVAKVNIEQK